MKKPDFKEHLKKISLFSGLNKQDIDILSSAAVLKRFSKGQQIIRNLELGTSLFIIISGRAKVVLETEEGKEFIVDILGPLDFFGELALLDGKPRSATVIALEATELIMLGRDTFLSELKLHADMQLKLLEIVCGRLRRANHQIESLAFLDVCGRLARLLLDMAVGAHRDVPTSKESVGAQDFVPTRQNHKEPIEIKINISHSDLASQIGTTKETLSRVFKTLESMRLIKRKGNNIIIHNLEELEERIS